MLFHPFPKPEIVHVRITCFNDVSPLTARRRGPPTTFLGAFLRVGLAHDSQTFAFLPYSPKGFQRRSVIFWVECPFNLYDNGTTERSFNAVERRSSTLTSTICTAADCEERQIYTTCLFAESVRLRKDDGFLLSPIGAHCCLRGDWGKRGDLTWQPAVKHQRPAAKTTNSNCCDRAAVKSKATQTRTTGVKNSRG